MDSKRSQLLRDLLAYGQREDRGEEDRLRRYRNITHDTGEFLSLLIQALAARRVLEVGTSNGYSTIWIADALEPTDGRVTTIDNDPGRSDEAAANFAKAGVESRIEQRRGHARDVLPAIGGGAFDVVFLDAERSEYTELWPLLAPQIRRDRGLLVVDNAISHQHELVEFTEMLKRDPKFATSLVPVGKGEFLALSLP